MPISHTNGHSHVSRINADANYVLVVGCGEPHQQVRYWPAVGADQTTLPACIQRITF